MSTSYPFGRCLFQIYFTQLLPTNASPKKNEDLHKHKRAPPYRDITLDKEISLKPAKVLDDKMFHMFQNVGLVKDTTSTNSYRCEQNF